MSEIKELVTIQGDSSSGTVRIKISMHPTCCITTLASGEESVIYKADDLFAALVKLRLDLESRHVFVACNGARKDVFPSGMAREMSRGRKAYVLKLGLRPDRDEVVDIFDAASPEQLGSVKEQQDYFIAWRESFVR